MPQEADIVAIRNRATWPERRAAEILDQEPGLFLGSLLDVERGAADRLARPLSVPKACGR